MTKGSELILKVLLDQRINFPSCHSDDRRNLKGFTLLVAGLVSFAIVKGGATKEILRCALNDKTHMANINGCLTSTLTFHLVIPTIGGISTSSIIVLTGTIKLLKVDFV